jgi:hypothetical protein
MPRLAAQLSWRGLHFDALLLHYSGRILARRDGPQIPPCQILRQHSKTLGALQRSRYSQPESTIKRTALCFVWNAAAADRHEWDCTSHCGLG